MTRAVAIKRAQKIREVMLDYGVPEVSIEILPGRPTSGDVWNALDAVGVLSHHIASRPTPDNPTPGLALVKKGRPPGPLYLPGPLANGTAGVDLVYRIICLGLANHPGFGGPLVLSGPLGAFRVPENVGRPYLWGTEYEGGYSEEVWDRVYQNSRTKKKMSFREFMGRSNGALCEAIWLPGISSRERTPNRAMDLSTYHGEHKTWAPDRKPDRLGYSTRSGRQEIRKYKETDMEFKDWSEESKQELADRVSQAVLTSNVNVRKGGGGRKKISVRQAVARSANSSLVTREAKEDVLEAIAEQSDNDNSEESK